MGDPLAVLIVEDSNNDAQLIVHLLKNAGYEITYQVVETAAQMTAALEKQAWDCVIADYRLPQFDAPAALTVLQATGLDLPFIVVSGTIGEETAVALMKAGAHDYLMKDRLARLSPAVKRELAEAQVRGERRQAEEALRQSEELFWVVLTNILDPVFITDQDGQFTFICPNITASLGYSLEDIQALGNISNLVGADLFSLAELETRGEIANVERVIVDRYGRQRIFLVTVKRVSIGSGTVLYTCHDITERKQAEKALRESEQQLRLIADNIPAIVNYVNAQDLRYRFVNRVYADMYGMLPEQIQGKQVKEILDEAAYARALPYIDRARSGERVSYENVVLDRGEPHWFNVNYIPEFDAQGTVQSVIVLAVDITDRKRAEEALYEQQQVFRTLVENSPDIIARYDRDCQRTYINPVYLKVAQIPRQELLATAPIQRSPLPAASAVILQNLLRKVLDSGVAEAVDVLWPKADNLDYWYNVYASPEFDREGRVVSVMTISRDISNRKRAEEALKRRAAQLALLSEVGRKIVAVRELHSVLETTARLIQEYFGYHHVALFTTNHERGELTMAARAGEFVNLFPSDHRLKLGQGMVGWAALHGEPLLANDVRVEPRYVNFYGDRLPTRSELAVPLQVAQANVGVLDVQSPQLKAFDENDVLVIKTLADQIAVAIENARLYEAIQRHAAELEERVIERTAELAHQRERERAILDALGEGVVFTDRAGTIEYINPAMERLTGFTTQESVGQNPRIWQSGQTSRALYQQLWATITRGEMWQGELVNRHRDGRLYEAALTAAALTNPDRQIVGFVGVQRDITRQKELDRLKDQFVANVTHELRTPLTSIMINLDLLEHGKSDKRDRYQATLRREAERLRTMIEDLLDLSRLDRQTAPVELTPLDLHQFLGQLVADRATVAAERQLTLEFLPTAVAPLALAEISMLTQVVSNLMTNALNYTPAGGSVIVQTHAQRASGQDWLTVTVRDTGPGIAAPELPHVFERFYRGTVGRTASAPGTGLGLAISKEIMERLGGRITVVSETATEGQGTAFTVWLQARAAG